MGFNSAFKGLSLDDEHKIHHYFLSRFLYFRQLIYAAKHLSGIMPYLQMVERWWCSVEMKWPTLSPQTFTMWPARVLLRWHSYPSFEALMENFL